MGAATTAVLVQPDNPAAPPRIERISLRVKAAIDAMVDRGQKRSDAAAEAGITDAALYSALCKPHVLAYRNDRLRVLRSSAASRTIARIDRLADEAESEHVKLEANKHLASLDEMTSPVSRSEITHKGVGPGLQIVIAAPEAQIGVRQIDSLPHDGGFVNAPKRLRELVPHPSQGTRQISGEILAPARQAEGEKRDGRNLPPAAHAPPNNFWSEPDVSRSVTPAAKPAGKKFLPGDKCRALGKKLAPRTELKRKQAVAREKRKAAVAEWKTLSRAERRKRILEGE